MDRLPVDPASWSARSPRHDVDDESTGEGPAPVQRGAHRGQARRLREHGISASEVLFIDNLNVGSYLRDTLIADKLSTPEGRSWRSTAACGPGDPPTLETAQTLLFNNLFFNPSATTCRRSAASS